MRTPEVLLALVVGDNTVQSERQKRQEAYPENPREASVVAVHVDIGEERRTSNTDQSTHPRQRE
eukprot:11740419-Prorocentrum_lima.AAC.1